MTRWHMPEAPFMPPPFFGSWKRTPGWGPPQFGMGARWSPYGQAGSGDRWSPQSGAGDRWSPHSGSGRDPPAAAMVSLFSAPPSAPAAAPSPAVLPRTHVPGQDGVPDRVDPPPASGRPPPAKKRKRTVLDRVKGLFRQSGRKAQRVVGRTATSALDTALDSFDQQLQDSVERATSRLPGVGRGGTVQNPTRKRSGVKRKSSSVSRKPTSLRSTKKTSKRRSRVSPCSIDLDASSSQKDKRTCAT